MIFGILKRTLRKVKRLRSIEKIGCILVLICICIYIYYYQFYIKPVSIYIHPSISREYSSEKGNHHLCSAPIDKDECVLRIPLKDCIVADPYVENDLKQFHLIELVYEQMEKDQMEIYPLNTPMNLPIRELQEICSQYALNYPYICIFMYKIIQTLYDTLKAENKLDLFDIYLQIYLFVTTRSFQNQEGKYILIPHVQELNNSLDATCRYELGEDGCRVFTTRRLEPTDELTIEYNSSLTKERLFLIYHYLEDGYPSHTTQYDLNQYLPTIMIQALQDPTQEMSILELFLVEKQLLN